MDYLRSNKILYNRNKTGAIVESQVDHGYVNKVYSEAQHAALLDLGIRNAIFEKPNWVA